MAAAIDWLLAQQVPLFAMPLGDTVDHDAIGHALERARWRGVRVFAAAGNAHPETIVFPARHNAALAIGAVDPSGHLRAECCRLPALDGLAPGTDIPASVDGWRVERRSGSSVACVVAAGLAALSVPAPMQQPPSNAPRAFTPTPHRRRSRRPA